MENQQDILKLRISELEGVLKYLGVNDMELRVQFELAIDNLYFKLNELNEYNND